MRLGIFRIGPAHAQALISAELYLQLARYGARDFILDREHIVDAPVVALVPTYGFVRRRDEADGDTNPITRSLNASLKHVADVKLLRNLSRTHSLGRHSESAASADYTKTCLRERSRDFLSEALAEVVIRFITTEIREWQHQIGRAHV